jgi:AraC family transcriptional regulator
MFEEEYRRRINKVVDFIEKNSGEKLSLELLSRYAGISPFHLHRLFLVYSGEPIAGFIRRIRLSAGYSRLQKDPKAGLSEIAGNLGYDSISSFVRAFKKRFSITPKVSTLQKSESLSLWKTQKSETSKTVLMPDRIESRASQVILGVMERGYQNRSFQKAAERAFSRTLELIRHHGIDQSIGRATAVVFDDPDLVDPLSMKYFGGFEWSRTEDCSFDGLTTLQVGPGLYAVFSHQGSYATLWQTWNAAYRNWLPNSGYQLADVFPFEIYVNDPRTVRRAGDLLTEIYLPLQRAFL